MLEELTAMHDPLVAFDWTSLYRRYDESCRRFNSQSPHLARFGSDRPASDRSLYYRLIDCYGPAVRQDDPDPVGLYEALLYWKLYSQGTTAYHLAKMAPGTELRVLAAASLPRLLARLPARLDRNVGTIVRTVQTLDEYELPRMKGRCAIPVRSTFLHFLYPSTVPVFDRMVLQAVGVDHKGANKDYSVFREFVPFAWALADRHAQLATLGHRESPLRLIDMASWVHRGQR
jgi:hypothetical protein